MIEFKEVTQSQKEEIDAYIATIDKRIADKALREKQQYHGDEHRLITEIKMNSNEFCFWLQGFIELNKQPPTDAQWDMIVLKVDGLSARPQSQNAVVGQGVQGMRSEKVYCGAVTPT